MNTHSATIGDPSIPQAMQHWQEFETILLDMDGTILDLAFDNYFWRELVPRCLARARGVPLAEIHSELFGLYAGKQGSLDWYCIDYWTKELDLDLRSLKSASSHRVRFLPGAEHFLAHLGRSGQRVALVTNAHGYTLEVKKGVTGLGRYIETFVSSHDVGVPKEDAGFWPAAARLLDFDPQKTLFIDDSLPVLRAADAFGLEGVLAVSRPDSRHPPCEITDFPSVEAIGHLLTGR